MPSLQNNCGLYFTFKLNLGIKGAAVASGRQLNFGFLLFKTEYFHESHSYKWAKTYHSHI